jgi:NAD(P)-dependent dehydrogenase (short-subunit alcohol dehydrogenase family)
MDLELEGKTVIVTGGSGGIGRGLVWEFAREGCNVVNAGRDLEAGRRIAEQARQAGLRGKVAAIRVDVTQRASVDVMVAETLATFGAVHVLINNAGGSGGYTPFENYSEAEFRADIALNIHGVANGCWAVAPHMLQRGSGAIINITSAAARSPASCVGLVTYGSTKSFVEQFTRALAYEWGSKGIRINNIAPGWTVPHRVQDVASEGSFWNKFGFQMLGTPEQMQQALENGTLKNMKEVPIPRLGRPEDIAYGALYLASDRTAGYVTGQTISISGGAQMP